MNTAFSKVDPSWLPLLNPAVAEIVKLIEGEDISPPQDQIFAAFTYPIDHYRVVIIGQDPYPTRGMANGLAFSVNANIEKLPGSLRNILKEYSEDLGLPVPASGDLSKWNDAGVLLLNRHLTISQGTSASHLNIGWAPITEAVAKALGQRGVVAILWGKHAQELKNFFRNTVESVHPSPLSAYRGFFGSRPFSTVNSILAESGKVPINWNLE